MSRDAPGWRPGRGGEPVMRAVVIALSLLVLVSTGAVAQQPAPAPQASPMDNVNTGKVVAVGIGALLGIVAAEAVVVGDAAAIVGGVAGGLVGAWWYSSGSETASPRGNVKQTGAREAAYQGGGLVIVR